MSKINILWFRRDLRLEDHAALSRCLDSDLSFIPIFIFDKEILKNLKNKDDSRVQFIHKTLSVLKDKIQAMGGDLRIYYDSPKRAWKNIIEEFDVETVYANEDYEPKTIRRDRSIETFLNKNHIYFNLSKDQCIFAKDEVLKKDGKPYTVFTPYKNAWRAKLEPTDIASFKFKIERIDTKLFTLEPEVMLGIDDLGFVETDVKNNIKSIRKKIINEYKEKRDFPALDATSRLGLHLRFGTVSIRKCVQAAYHSEEHTWLSELIWREFFMQILYNFPHVENAPFKAKYESIKWLNSKADFEKWCEGKTGYPLVDAGMRELNETGFMHNRVRMVCASFLIKHLLIDWRWGEKYFATKLLDYELSANNGNWQWVAGTGCDSAPYFRIFNPEIQLKKFDSKLIYVKKWVPEFGTDDYPAPIVEHRSAYNRALRTYKLALS
jgi:deoxyribodipyrimidine photo-lyase